MEGDTTLRRLLAEHPDAIVAAIDQSGRLTPVPLSVPLTGQRTFDGRTGMDFIVPADHLTVLDGWRRSLREPLVTLAVHMTSSPDRLTTIHMVDARATHGVHVVLVLGENLDTILEWGEIRPARQGIARSKRNATATFLEVDDATSELLGWRPHELVGSSTLDLVHPEDADRAVQSWMEMRSGGSRRVRIRLRHSRGHYVWCEVTNHNLLDDDEHGYVLTEMNDISDEMAQLEALRDRERQLARLAEALPIGICHLRPNRELVYANAPFVDLLGSVDNLDELVARVAPENQLLFGRALDHAFGGIPATIEVVVQADDRTRRCEFNVRALTADDGTVDGVIVCAADVTDRSRLRDELEHRASHDALTDCLNRTAIAAAVERALREAHRVVVAFIDLDDFKTVNDEIGHAAGDELLRVAAERLRGATRPGDALGRHGGDEFVVVCHSDGDDLDPEDLADRLRNALEGDVDFGVHRLSLQASVGAAISDPGEMDAEALLQRADAAMYVDKRAARPRVSLARW